jgi:hypothetical protein
MRPYKGSIKDEANFRTLFQNSVLLVGHVFETAYCYNKLTREEFAIFEFDNEPTCALVGNNNDWCLVGGDILVLRTWVDNTLRMIDELKDIYELKALDAYNTQILTDPWNEHSAVWQLQIDLTKLTRPISLFKVKDFIDYIGKPYTERVAW